MVAAKVSRANVVAVKSGSDFTVGFPSDRSSIPKVDREILSLLAVVHEAVHEDGPLADAASEVVAVPPAAPRGCAAATAVAVVVVVVVVAVPPAAPVGGAAAAAVAVVVVIVVVVTAKQPRADLDILAIGVHVLCVDARHDLAVPKMNILSLLPLQNLVHDH